MGSRPRIATISPLARLRQFPIDTVTNSASFEVLGASIYTGKTNDAAAAMFTFTNSSASVSSMTTADASGSEYDEWVSETRSGNGFDAPGYSLGICSGAVHSYSRPNGSVIPLYIGH